MAGKRICRVICVGRARECEWVCGLCIKLVEKWFVLIFAREAKRFTSARFLGCVCVSELMNHVTPKHTQESSLNKQVISIACFARFCVGVCVCMQNVYQCVSCVIRKVFAIAASWVGVYVWVCALLTVAQRTQVQGEIATRLFLVERIMYVQKINCVEQEAVTKAIFSPPSFDRRQNWSTSQYWPVFNGIMGIYFVFFRLLHVLLNVMFGWDRC